MDDDRDGHDSHDSDTYWEQVATGFAELGDLLRSGFEDPENRDRAGKVRQAWSEFATAAQGLGQALATTVNDPEIRAGARRAFGSLVEAIDASVRDVVAGTAARARPGRGRDDADGE